LKSKERGAAADVVASAAGPYAPVATNDTGAGRTQHRRVEISPPLSPKPDFQVGECVGDYARTDARRKIDG